jgi:hypothetical protein
MLELLTRSFHPRTRLQLQFVWCFGLSGTATLQIGVEERQVLTCFLACAS